MSAALDPAPTETNEVAELMQLRYRDGIVPDGPWNEVIASLLAHRSVRAFLRDPLPPGTLERLVAAASSASTSSNLQTWSVVAVADTNGDGIFTTVMISSLDNDVYVDNDGQ